VFLLEAYRHLHERNFLAVQNIVQEGSRGEGLLGRIHGARFEYAQFSSKVGALRAAEGDESGKTPVPNIFSLEFGGGSLVDLGVYCVAAAVRLFGAPEEWHYDPVVLSTGADGAGYLTLQYGREKNFNVLCHHSKLYNSSSGPTCAVFGEHGTLEIGSVTDIETVRFKPNDKGPVRDVGVEDPFSGGEKGSLNLSLEAEEFARIMREGDEGAVRAWEKLSRDVVRVTEKARREAGIVFASER
jgi:predicted dehydrogenase